MSESQEVIVSGQSNEVAVVDQASALISMVERVALNPAADMDKLERLLDMQERMLNREAQVAFNAAMSRLQAELPSITENGEIKHNGKLISSYAKFEDIVAAIRQPLVNHGFSVTFKSNFEDNKLLITGIVAHAHGHREETTMILPFDTSGSKNSVQAIGSSVSYGKRYVLCMLLNISTGGEDNDGSTTALPESLKEDQIQHIKSLLDSSSIKHERWLKHAKFASFDVIPADKYQAICDALEAQ